MIALLGFGCAFGLIIGALLMLSGICNRNIKEQLQLLGGGSLIIVSLGTLIWAALS